MKKHRALLLPLILSVYACSQDLESQLLGTWQPVSVAGQAIQEDSRAAFEFRKRGLCSIDGRKAVFESCTWLVNKDGLHLTVTEKGKQAPQMKTLKIVKLEAKTMALYDPKFGKVMEIIWVKQ